MSVRVISDVFRRSRSSGTTRLVLLALADVANDDGEVTAYARGRKVLASKANCSDGTVGRAIKALVDLGEVQVLRVGNGRRSSDYRITLPVPNEGGQSEGGHSDTPQGVSEKTPRGSEMTPLGGQDVLPISPSMSVSSPSLPVAAKAKGHRYSEEFEHFWLAYERKGHKIAAWKAFAEAVKLGEARAGDIALTAGRWVEYWQRTGTARKYTLDAERWLTKGGYLTEPPEVDHRSEKRRRRDAELADYVNRANGNGHAVSIAGLLEPQRQTISATAIERAP